MGYYGNKLERTSGDDEAVYSHSLLNHGSIILLFRDNHCVLQHSVFLSV